MFLKMDCTLCHSRRRKKTDIVNFAAYSQDSTYNDARLVCVQVEARHASLQQTGRGRGMIPFLLPYCTGLPDYVKYVGHKALTLSAPGAENAHWDFDFVASPHTRQSSFYRGECDSRCGPEEEGCRDLFSVGRLLSQLDLGAAGTRRPERYA